MSTATSPLSEWLTRLESFSPNEIELGLDRVTAVLERLELPRPRRALHVGGTNGKGSSVAMLQSIMLAHGESVGAYTSPHVNDYNERIAVNGVPADDDSIIAAFERVEAARQGTELTYFEYGTLAALVVFAEHDVDNIILEVGMGGRLDAVNAIEPDAVLITNVSLDHCAWLGDDIETIAIEKAGIMRANKPVVFASTDVPQSIIEWAAARGATLLLARRDYDWTVSDNGDWSWRGRKVELQHLSAPGLAGEFQYGNAAAVLALVEASGLDQLLSDATLSAALASVHLAGRMQSIVNERHWLLDVAHNPAAAHVLAETIGGENVSGKTVAIIGMLDDKDVEGVAALLDSVVDQWVAVTADSARAIPAEELGRIVANVSNKACLVAGSLDEALAFAREITHRDDRILVTGSFYLVGPVLEQLR